MKRKADVPEGSAPEPNGRGHIVEGAVGLELVEEPEALLGEGEGERPRARDRRERRKLRGARG